MPIENVEGDFFLKLTLAQVEAKTDNYTQSRLSIGNDKERQYFLKQFRALFNAYNRFEKDDQHRLLEKHV